MAFTGRVVHPFVAFEIALPGGPLRLLDGAAMLKLGGQTFTGRDPTYGSVASYDAVDDGADSEAPRNNIFIAPPTNTAAAALAAPGMKGVSVTIWLGEVDPVTGLALPNPELPFLGEVDVPILHVGKGRRLVELQCASNMDRFFAADEGARLSDSFHRSIWPDERGLEFVTTILDQQPWGSDAPRPGVSPGPGGAGGGGLPSSPYDIVTRVIT